MAELDFSKLNNLAYRGMETEEQKSARDTWVEKGYTIVEGIKTPFKSLESMDGIRTPINSQSGSCGEKTLNSQEFPYKGIYRAVFDYHQKHDTPRTLEEWEAACDEFAELTAGKDENDFMLKLLVCVYEEMERRYKEQRKAEDEMGK